MLSCTQTTVFTTAITCHSWLYKEQCLFRTLQLARVRFILLQYFIFDGNYNNLVVTLNSFLPKVTKHQKQVNACGFGFFCCFFNSLHTTIKFCFTPQRKCNIFPVQEMLSSSKIKNNNKLCHSSPDNTSPRPLTLNACQKKIDSRELFL